MYRARLLSFAVIAGLAAAFSGQALGLGAGSGAAKLAHERWRVFARSPLGAPAGASVVWDGRELLEIGGSNPARQPRELRSAAAFDPVTDHWRMIAAVPPTALATGAATVWTGSRLFVFGASEPPGPPPTGRAGVYSPSTNRWTVTAPAPLALPSSAVAGVWSGARVIVAAVSGSGRHAELNAAAYDPTESRWQALTIRLANRHYPVSVEMVTTNHGVFLWSLWSRGYRVNPREFAIYSGVDVFRLTGSTWRDVTGKWPQQRTVDQPVFTGSQVLLGASQVWCGACSHPSPFDSNGWSVNPATLAVTKLPHGPLDDIQPQILWTGSTEIAIDISGEIEGPQQQVLPGDIATLNPKTGRWYQGPRATRSPGQLPAVWDGSHLLVLDKRGQLLSYGPR